MVIQMPSQNEQKEFTFEFGLSQRRCFSVPNLHLQVPFASHFGVSRSQFGLTSGPHIQEVFQHQVTVLGEYRFRMKLYPFDG